MIKMKLEINKMNGKVSEIEVRDVVGISFDGSAEIGIVRYISNENPKEVQVYEIEKGDSIFISNFYF